MSTLILYMFLTSAAYYLGARAMITRWLWSKYPSWLDYYMTCAACSGFLYGVLCALAVGWTQDLALLGLSGRSVLTLAVSGVGSMVWTPIIANLQINALYQLGVADPRAQVEPDPLSGITPESEPSR